MMWSVVVFSLCFALCWASDSLIVETVHGPINGKIVKSRKGSNVNVWLGVPFAEPPVGDLRWRGPQYPQAWNNLLNTTSLKSVCMQSYNIGNEDCLYLNVYVTGTPSSDDGGAYPVLFYLTGDALMNGDANAGFEEFVSNAGDGRGIIVVVPSFRLNVFGFLATSELSEEQSGVSGNYGLQDQIFALEWVQQNIARFNGNPNLVTILGHASGGTSVLGLVASPKASGLFHRAISLSGSLNISMSLHQAEQQNAHFAVDAGCRNDSSTTAAAVLSCLRGKTAEELVELIPSSWDGRSQLTLPQSVSGAHLPGLLIVDGVTIPRPIDEALVDGSANTVPLLLSSMGQESDHVCQTRDTCIGIDTLEKDVHHMGASDWLKFLESYFAPWDVNLSAAAQFSDVSSVGAVIHDLYLSEAFTDVDANPQKAYNSIVSDVGVLCPIIEVVKRGKLSGEHASLFMLVNNFHLSSPIGGDLDKFPIKYAFNGLDASLLRESWSDFDSLSLAYVPDDRDVRGARLMQSLVFSFMINGTLPVEENESADESCDTVVIKISGSDVKAVPIRKYNREKCEFFDLIGLSERELWWSN